MCALTSLVLLSASLMVNYLTNVCIWGVVPRLEPSEIGLEGLALAAS